MQPLNGLDSLFLYSETPNAHMNVGGLDVYEGTLTFAEFKEFLASRLHLAPRLMQRLVQVPLSIDHPYWVDDPDFNIDDHLHHAALPAPGGWKELRKLTSRIFSHRIDRSRPLWEFIFVEGLNSIPQVPEGSVAVISKVHHAAIDGASGAEILGVLFDTSPEPRNLPAPPPREVAPLPSDIELTAKSLYNFVSKPLKLPNLLFQTAKSVISASQMGREQGIKSPTMPFSAPKTSINGSINSLRQWDTALLSLQRVKNLRKLVPGATLNDVVLAICTGALREYLIEKNDLPEEPLVAMIPVSTRTSSEKEDMGNQVSAMLVQLPTNIDDPIEQLRRLNKNTAEGKAYQGAIDSKTLVGYADFVPFGIASELTHLYSRMKGPDLHNPLFNVIITNVPGPQIPLYMNGKKLLAHMGMAPIPDGIGMILPIFTYNGVLSISPSTASNLVPDVSNFSKMLRRSANALEQLALDAAGKVKADVDQCHATTKAGKPCRNRPVGGTEYCRRHKDYKPSN